MGVCVVTGVGPGNGISVVKRFARQGYQVAMLARNRERLDAWAEAEPNAHAFPIRKPRALCESDRRYCRNAPSW